MTFGNMFNEEALAASLILQAQDKMRQMIAQKTAEGRKEVSALCKDQFMMAMERFARATEVIAEQGDPEKMVELVEQLRAYVPLKSLEELNAFHETRRRFSSHARMAIIDAGAAKGAEEANRWFVREATPLIARAAEAGALYDKVQLDKVSAAWNEIATQYHEKLHQAAQELYEQSKQHDSPTHYRTEL